MVYNQFGSLPSNGIHFSAGVLPVNLNDLGQEQRWIQDPVKNLRWSFLQRYLTAETINYFGKKTSSEIFDRVINTPLRRWITFLNFRFKIWISINDLFNVAA